MKHNSRIVLGLAATVLAFAAQAGGGVQARDVPRISNGGTGVIGGVEPGTSSRQANQAGMSYGTSPSTQAAAVTQGSAGTPSSVMPEAQAQSTWRGTATMGAGRTQSSSDLAARHSSWGTPD
jgi:hypothetical protein